MSALRKKGKTMHDILQELPDTRERRGLLGWWLRLTAPPGAQQYERAASHQERERLRRSQLTSFTAPFVFIAPLLLLQQASVDTGTLIGILVLMSVSLLALLFNRAGKQTAAALFLILAMDGVIEGALLTAPGGLGSGWLLSFDLFIIPLIAVGVLLQRRFLWIFLLLHVGCILGDFYGLPHTQDLTLLIKQWHGPAIAFARPVLIQIGGCLFSFIEVRSTDEAIRRADRAQLVVALQRSIAREKEDLERSVLEIQNILTRAANGDFAVRSSLPQEHALWRINVALNTLFTRLQRSKQTERQVEQEIQRLADALQAARRGQHASWPLPGGGPLDPLIRELRAAVGVDQHTAHAENPAQKKYHRPSGLL
jgi:hypothetical protein